MTVIDNTLSTRRQSADYTCPMHPQIRQPNPGTCSICGMALVRMGGKSLRLPVLAAALASLGMIGVYFGVLTLVSGWEFTVSEFSRFWYFVVALAAGFGLQIGLYVYLRQILTQHHAAGKMVAVSGTTSTAAMISCCAHYVANILPVVGAAGLVTLVAQYQVELFWIGLAFNAAGIAFITNRILRAGRHV
jgi:Cu+-exporting ATPase